MIYLLQLSQQLKRNADLKSVKFAANLIFVFVVFKLHVYKTGMEIRITLVSLIFDGFRYANYMSILCCGFYLFTNKY